MISHPHKIIFIHIGRTGGSAIERSIMHTDWWNINKHTKHLRSTKAKLLYYKYWQDYFKFSWVRNPFDRYVSVYLHFLNRGGTKKDFMRYMRRLIIKNPNSLKYSTQCCVVGNEMEFIGKFENIKQDFKRLKVSAHLPKDITLCDKIIYPTNREKGYKQYYTPLLVKALRRLWKDDLDRFNYDF